MSDDDIRSEYRIAYQQLQHLQQVQKRIREQLERDWNLAWSRYVGAQREYLELALGEDDEFLVSQED